MRVGSIAGIVAALFVVPVASSAREWEVNDSVQARYFVREGTGLDERPHDPVVWTPDLSKFFVLSQVGDLNCDCTRYTLEIFSARDVLDSVGAPGATEIAPHQRFTLQSYNNYPAIAAPRWTSDGSAIEFVGAERGENLRALYRYSLATRDATRMSPLHAGFGPYAISAGRAAYLATVPGHDANSPLHTASRSTKRYEVYVGNGRSSRAMETDLSDVSWISLSPRGRRLVLVGRTANAEAQTLLTSSTTIRSVELPVALSPRAPPALWTDDEQTIVSVVESDDAQSVITLDLHSLQLRHLATLPATAIISRLSWSSNPPRGVEIAYELEGLHYRATASMPANLTSLIPHELNASLAAQTPFSTRVEEAPNRPQALVAQVGDSQVTIVDVDSRLSGVDIAQSQAMRFTTEGGREFSGLLTLPVRDTGSPPPLVIQIYRYMPDLFRPDGPYSSVYAAQPLAAAGMAVLGISYVNESGLSGTPDEGPEVVARIDAAIDELTQRGLVDGSNVGLVGFSRGGYEVLYAITHPGTARIKAAAIFDSTTLGFAEYVRVAGEDLAPPVRFIERMNGGRFWTNRGAWLDNAPVFNVHRSGTPIVWSAINMDSGAYEMRAAYMLANRPFEFQMFPGAAHNLARPRERYASLSSTVDWMTFWLLDEENPAPDRAAQYFRWRQMRAEWDVQQMWEAAGNPVGSTPSDAFSAAHAHR